MSYEAANCYEAARDKIVQLLLDRWMTTGCLFGCVTKEKMTTLVADEPQGSIFGYLIKAAKSGEEVLKTYLENRADSYNLMYAITQPLSSPVLVEIINTVHEIDNCTAALTPPAPSTTAPLTQTTPTPTVKLPADASTIQAGAKPSITPEGLPWWLIASGGVLALWLLWRK